MTNEKHVIDLKRKELPPKIERIIAQPAPIQMPHIGGKLIAAALLTVCAGVLIFSFTHRRSSQNSSSLLTSPASVSVNNTNDPNGIIAKVGNLMLLPTGEIPTIAKVENLAPLKGEAFFANAKIGDYVLIYTIAKKAILYRPSENRIIEVGPVTK